jgi:uncharacterized protein
MKLTVVERAILYNQFDLLTAHPDADVTGLENLQTILEQGYQPLYGRIFDHIVKDEISEEEATFVYDVLTMFEAFQRFEENTGEKVNGLASSFRGFWGNTEYKFVGFVKYLVTREERWTYLNIREFDSHSPVIDVYTRMVTEWRKLPMPDRVTALTRAQVDAIQAEAVHPDNRGRDATRH